jgi:L-glyceraldehyde 3-phosphate reductase
MSLNWILKDDDVTTVLVGASKPEQLLDNIKIVNRTPFSTEELTLIDEITAEMSAQ